jgi:gamma-tubulin complex component 2
MSEYPCIDLPFVDPSLSDLVERILPLATYYTGITSFIEMRSHLDYGLVNHALCASIRDMLKVCPETVC